MAASNPRERLQSALDELQEQDLKRFKARLNQGGLAQGCLGISRRRLEKADALDVVELMISTYTAEGAITVCFEALEAINQRELAAKLMGH